MRAVLYTRTGPGDSGDTNRLHLVTESLDSSDAASRLALRITASL